MKAVRPSYARQPLFFLLRLGSVGACVLWQHLEDDYSAGALCDVETTVDVVPVDMTRLVQPMLGCDHIADVTEVRVKQHDPSIAGVEDEHEPGVGDGDVGGREERTERRSDASVFDQTHAVDRLHAAAVAHHEATPGSWRHQWTRQLGHVPRINLRTHTTPVQLCSY